MRGIEVKFNQERKTVGVESGMLTIHILDNNGDSRIYIGAVDYEKQKELLWCDWIPIKPGDKFSAKLTRGGDILNLAGEKRI